ncbi:MAG: S9 family peptidase [Chloroflexi bacterium]|nr:S9 family peptidase [Chloroflexota bacterium]
MPARRPMTPADLRRVVVVEELDLSLDGRTVVVVRRSIKGNRYVGHLFAIDLGARRHVPRPDQLTDGLTRDTKPRLAPDGRTLAFIRSDPTDDDKPAGIAILDLTRPGSVRMARPGDHGSVGEIAWSPDGRQLAFTAEVDPPRFLVGKVAPISRRTKKTGAANGHAAAEEPSPTARHMTRTDWRWDDEGHRDRWSHLFVIDRPGTKPRQVTCGDYGVGDIAWHPNGQTIAFSADRGPEPDLHPRTTIWAVDVDADAADPVDIDADAAHDPTADPREVLAPPGWATHPAWSPDGRWIAAVGLLEAEPLDDVSPSVIVGPADGSRPPIALAPNLDRPAGNWVDTDLNGWMVSGRHGPFWLDDATLLATISDRGRSHPVRHAFDPRTGRPGPNQPDPTSRDADGPWSDATTHTVAVARNGVIAVLGTLGTRAMEVMTLDFGGPGQGPAWTTRSNLGSRWQAQFDMPDMQRVEVPSQDGPTETWIASPPDAGDRALPTVVDVHGGPLGAWAPAPHLEVILLAARGYRVILPNIRGSTSYGRDWIRPQLGDWGGVDAADVHSAVDHVVKLGLADPARLGVFGLSYGGFMSNWMVGTTDRFKAAVSENGVTNQISTWANSDSGPEYDRASLLGDPFSAEGIDKLWRQSPLRHVTNVRTPLLMLQSEADLRCPPQDNEQFFIALRHLGRTVEYVLYPEESHTIAASGRPDRRIDRMTRVLDWFDRYLR